MWGGGGGRGRGGGQTERLHTVPQKRLGNITGQQVFCMLVHSIWDLYRYVKRIFNWIKHKEETEEDIYTRWEKDFDLIPLDKHGLFSEYLELGELFVLKR